MGMNTYMDSLRKQPKARLRSVNRRCSASYCSNFSDNCMGPELEGGFALSSNANNVAKPVQCNNLPSNLA